MAKRIWRVRERIQEGDKVFMPGDVYDGPQLKNLGPKHPWVKAGWFDVETPNPEPKSEPAPKDKTGEEPGKK